MVESKVREVTIWASGVVQDKEARDTANCIAAAAAQEGKFVQSFDNYVDLPDRVNVPVRKYARISSEEIEEKYLYENEHPNVVVVVEPALVKGFNILRGMPKGGVLVVNTDRDPDYILKFIPNKELLKAIATIDASKIVPKTIDDFMDAEGAAGGGELGRGLGAVLAGAVAKASGDIKLENLKVVVQNSIDAEKGFDEVKVKAL